ncbi:MBL fold metallo-hydrolase [Halobacillus karajensis]|nr:MBL fold metallo-hydrolase [Halobacillus karajensis]
MDLGNGVFLIDGFDMGFEGRTGAYVLLGDRITLVETGPSPSVPKVLAGLDDLNVPSEKVEFIILTHIHLDHAGGVGLLLKECPNAKVIVHEKGKRHLADPSRLIEGAKAVYGQDFEELFDPILAVPEDKLYTKADGDTLTISKKRQLTFYDTPGHAKHHLGIHDSWSNGIFTGDTAGIRYHQTTDYGLTFYLPTTSPNQFDPDAMLQCIRRFRDMKPSCLYFGHFGKTEYPDQTFDQIMIWIPIFVKEAEEALKRDEGPRGIQQRLYKHVASYLDEKGVPRDHEIYDLLNLDFEVCSMGLSDYMKKKSRA